MLGDPENQRDYIWANSEYSSKYFKDLLSLGLLKIESMRENQEITPSVQVEQSAIPIGLKFGLEQDMYLVILIH